MARTPSSLFDQAYTRFLSPAVDEEDPDSTVHQDMTYNPKAYISEPSCLESETWGDISAPVHYRDEAAEKLTALRAVVPLEVPRTAAKTAMNTENVPTTKLMQKLFKPAEVATTKSKAEPVVSAEEKLSKLIADRVQDLTKETSKQSLLQEKLSLLKRQLTEKAKLLEKERFDLQSLESAAKEEVKQYRDSELQRAEKELRVRERNQKALAALPSRKDREEKENLVQTLQKLQEECKARKARHQLAKERAKKQLEDCKQHREELLREKARMMQIMPQDVEVPVTTQSTQKKLNVLYRDPSPEVREPIDHTFEEEEEIRSADPAAPNYQEIMRDGRVVKVHSDGHEETVMQSGTRKEIYPSGYTLVRFANNDEKRDFPDGRSVYYYSAPGTTQVVHPDGLQVYLFSDGQKETHYPDGNKKIRFPNGTKKTIAVSGEERTEFLDGIVVEIDRTGMKTMTHPGGHKEITYPDGRRVRQLLNGTLQRLS